MRNIFKYIYPIRYYMDKNSEDKKDTIEGLTPDEYLKRLKKVEPKKPDIQKFKLGSRNYDIQMQNLREWSEEHELWEKRYKEVSNMAKPKETKEVVEEKAEEKPQVNVTFNDIADFMSGQMPELKRIDRKVDMTMEIPSAINRVRCVVHVQKAKKGIRFGLRTIKQPWNYQIITDLDGEQKQRVASFVKEIRQVMTAAEAEAKRKAEEAKQKAAEKAAKEAEEATKAE